MTSRPIPSAGPSVSVVELLMRFWFRPTRSRVYAGIVPMTLSLAPIAPSKVMLLSMNGTPIENAAPKAAGKMLRMPP